MASPAPISFLIMFKLTKEVVLLNTLENIFLSSSIEKQLQKIDQLLEYGELQEALKLIENGLQKKNLRKEHELFYLVHKSQTLFFLGKVPEALQLTGTVLKECEKLNNSSLFLYALVAHAVCLRFTGKYNESVELVEKGLMILENQDSLSEEEFAKRKAQFLIWKASSIAQLGDVDKAMEMSEEALSLALKSGYKPTISAAYQILGSYHNWFKNAKKSEEYSIKAIETAKGIGNNFFLAWNLLGLAFIKKQKREYQEAIRLFEKVIALSKEMGSTLLLVNYTDLGEIYRVTFQLDKAIECYREGMKYNIYENHYDYFCFGLIYFWKYNLKEAQEYFLKALKGCEDVKEMILRPKVLFNLLLIQLELNMFDQAKQYLTGLEQIAKETGFERVNDYYHFGLIRFYIANGSITDLAQATELLNAFLQRNNLASETKLDVLYYLMEIRIKELTISASETTLVEAIKQTIRLEVEAEEQQLQWFLANVYRLQSQLALLELDAGKALALLEKAQIIADEIDVELLKQEIMKDKGKIEQQLGMWNNLQKEKPPIADRVKLVSLNNTMKDIAQETVLEDRDEETGKIIEYRKIFSLKL